MEEEQNFTSMSWKWGPWGTLYSHSWICWWRRCCWWQIVEPHSLTSRILLHSREKESGYRCSQLETSDMLRRMVHTPGKGNCGHPNDRSNCSDVVSQFSSVLFSSSGQRSPVGGGISSRLAKDEYLCLSSVFSDNQGGEKFFDPKERGWSLRHFNWIKADFPSYISYHHSSPGGFHHRSCFWSNWWRGHFTKLCLSKDFSHMETLRLWDQGFYAGLLIELSECFENHKPTCTKRDGRHTIIGVIDGRCLPSLPVFLLLLTS